MAMRVFFDGCLLFRNLSSTFSMPGVICSLDDLSKELEGFVWRHGLSDSFDQQLRYSVPAHLCHQFIRDCRYIAPHKPLNERMESFLNEELAQRKRSFSNFDDDDLTPPLIGTLQWLIDATRKHHFNILCNLSIGHTNILLTEFCRKTRLPDSAAERLREAVSYDAVPHEIYAKMKLLSEQTVIPRPRRVIPEVGSSSSMEVTQRTARESLEKPDVTTPLRPFSLTPRVARTSRSRSPRVSIEVKRRGYEKPEKKLSKPAPHSSHERVRKCRMSLSRSRRSGSSSHEEWDLNDDESYDSVAKQKKLIEHVKEESPTGTPKGPWWEQLSTFRNSKAPSSRS